MIENITYDKEADIEKIDNILQNIKMKQKVDSLPNGLETVMSKLFDEDGIELSGGEQQKMALCSAIYRDPFFIVLDEPTAMLSPSMEHMIYQDFNNFVTEKAAVYISHRMSSCRFCDVIAVFENGTITEYGNHEELMALNGKYRNMFEAQAQYYVSLKN